MHKSTRALLFNVLVFPGAGHFILQFRVMGYSLITAASVATITIFYYIMANALQVVQRVTNGEVPPDFFVIRKLVTEQQAAADTTLLNTAFLVLVISWLVGIIDIWFRSQTHPRRAGRKVKLDEQKTKSN